MGIEKILDSSRTMENREISGLSILPLQDVVISQILPLLSPRDWCALRAVDSDHLQIVTAFIAANRRLELPYCKQLTEAGLSLLTFESTCLQILISLLRLCFFGIDFMFLDLN